MLLGSTVRWYEGAFRTPMAPAVRGMRFRKRTCMSLINENCSNASYERRETAKVASSEIIAYRLYGQAHSPGQRILLHVAAIEVPVPFRYAWQVR